MLIVTTGRIKGAILTRVRDGDVPWDVDSISAALHDEITKLEVKPKAFMTVARCQLTGMKVRALAADTEVRLVSDDRTQAGPGVADIMQLIGKERTMDRLIMLAAEGGH